MARLDARVAARGPGRRPAGAAELQPDDGDRRWAHPRSVAGEPAAHAPPASPRATRRPGSRRWSSGAARGVELRLLPVLLGPAASRVRRAGAAVDDARCRRARCWCAASEVERLACAAGACRWQAFHAREPHEAGISVETLRHSLRVPDAVADGGARRGGAARAPDGSGRSGGRFRAFRPVARASDGGPAAPGGGGPGGRADGTHCRRTGGPAGPGDCRGRVCEQAALGGRRGPGGAGSLPRRPRRWRGLPALVREVGAGRARSRRGCCVTGPGLSRKFLIPLLEWADRSGITRREGEGRRLRRPDRGPRSGA